MITAKNRRFCQFIVEGFNQTEAAKQAGFKESSAKSVASQMMKKPEIQEYIKKLEEINNKYEDSEPIEEDVKLAEYCKNPVEKLIQLMNCDDLNIQLNAAKALLPYFELKKSERGDNRVGKKEMKEVEAVSRAKESKYATLSNQLNNVYEHEEE